MNGLDVFIILLIAGFVVLGAVRGFGQTAYDALGLYSALWLANTFSIPLAAHANFHTGGAGINHSWAYSLLFIVFSVILFFVSKYAYGMTLLNAGMFDKLLGITAGVIAGVILAHSLTVALIMADPERQGMGGQVAQGMVSDELYSFPGYHSVLDTITGATSYRRELPNMAGK